MKKAEIAMNKLVGLAILVAVLLVIAILTISFFTGTKVKYSNCIFKGGSCVKTSADCQGSIIQGSCDTDKPICCVQS